MVNSLEVVIGLVMFLNCLFKKKKTLRKLQLVLNAAAQWQFYTGASAPVDMSLF